MTKHPSAAELLDLIRGRIAPPREGEILRHLHDGCETCLAAAPTELVTDPGAARKLTAKEDSALESAIDRAFAVALREDRKLHRQRSQLERAIKVLVEGGVEGPEKLPRSMNQVEKVEALLAASWAVRYESLGMMVYLAQFAVSCAERLDARKYGVNEVFDLQCRAQAELGNAYRASDQFEKADRALIRSRQLFELGSRSRYLEIRLLELEASFYAYIRRFEDASVRLQKVLKNYRQDGEDHLAGRTLLQLGRYRGFTGNFEQALGLINESISLLDSERDPSLFYVAKQNQVEFLVWCKQYREAELQLFHLRAMQHTSGGRINELRQRWIAGRIEAGQDRLVRAERTFLEVRTGWAEFGSGYNAALVSLDLAAVLLALEKADAATETVIEAYNIFAALKIHREGLVILFSLQTACEMREATREAVEKVIRHMMKLEDDPTVELEE